MDKNTFLPEGVYRRVVPKAEYAVFTVNTIHEIMQMSFEEADYLIELGPGGGAAGGRIIATGTVKEIKKNPASVIAEYL